MIIFWIQKGAILFKELAQFSWQIDNSPVLKEAPLSAEFIISF
jgi:hypothetical protein